MSLTAIAGRDWLSSVDHEYVVAPCSNDTQLSCMWLQLGCTGGQVTW